ncbi:MAG: hypothetical protein SGJ11_15940 [Phycisphaerae bacterium]|mgnify:CR=1 FL=1|nr:hypothetical protein [Phycisphaerae bacterium]
MTGVVFGHYRVNNQAYYYALFLWQRGTFTTIPLPAPFDSARAIARADDGTILCQLHSPAGEFLAIWSVGGVPRALNDIIDPVDVGSLTAVMERPPSTDLSCDGVVDGTDLALLLGAWGSKL